jgi:hypothetical protein
MGILSESSRNLKLNRLALRCLFDVYLLSSLAQCEQRVQFFFLRCKGVGGKNRLAASPQYVLANFLQNRWVCIESPSQISRKREA